MSNLDTVIQHASEEDTLIDSAVDMIHGLQAQIVALKTPTTDAATAAKIDALDQAISTKKAQLVAALMVNTPVVAPTPANAPTVTPAAANTAAVAAIAANPAPASTTPSVSTSTVSSTDPSAWDVNKQYAIGDKITFQGATYTAATANVGSMPLANSTAAWTKSA